MATASVDKTVERPIFALGWMSNNLQFDGFIGHPVVFLNANDWSLSSTLPTVGLLANIIGGTYLVADYNINKPLVTSSIISGTITSFIATIPRPNLINEFITNATISVDTTIPKIQLSASIIVSGYLSLSSNINRIYVSITAYNSSVTTTPITLAVNTLNLANSTYTNFGFNSFFKLNNNYYGVNNTGIWKLGGFVDDTATIASEINTPISSFDKQGLKACTDAIILGRLSGQLEVVVVLDEQKERSGFIVNSDEREGLHRIRVKIPKGLQGSTWQFKIKNVDGSDFAINNFEVFLKELKRIR